MANGFFFNRTNERQTKNHDWPKFMNQIGKTQWKKSPWIFKLFAFLN